MGKVCYQILADLVVLVHLAFVVFAALGCFLIFKWRRCPWIHLPAVAWAALIEFCGWVCPLTPLENWLRQRSGMMGYQSGFIEHYVLPILYPTVLTRRLQIALGLTVIGVNLAIYVWVWQRSTRARI